MLSLRSKSAARREIVQRLYAAIVERSRAPVFFTTFEVSDTIDGRFDLLAVHAWLVLDALRTGKHADLSQGLMDTIFIGFDEGLRDLGTGDMGMGRRMKKIADAFYGRLSSYDASTDADSMRDTLLRNLYRGAGDEGHATVVARYVLEASAHIARSDIGSGGVDFGPLP